ncbi:hypothetical protein P7C70_g474, partial [Phenoliferia sp. Uapishka_3]
MSPVDELPSNLLYSIFDLTPHHMHQDLAKFALVRRSWREPAQRALSHTVFLRGEEKVQSWLASPCLHPTVGLILMNVRNDTGLKVLRTCPGISSLEVTRDTLAMLDAEDGGYAWCAQVSQLQHLMLWTTPRFPRDSATLKFRLQSLLIRANDIFVVHDIRTLLTSSQATLHSLSLDSLSNAFTQSLINFLKSPTGITLLYIHTLSLQWPAIESCTRWQKLFLNFPRLRSLEIAFDLGNEVGVAKIIGSLAIAIPPFTKVLTLYTHWQTNDRPSAQFLLGLLLEFVNLSVFADSIIELPWVPGWEFESSLGQTFRNTCEENGIRVLSRSGFL